MSRFLDGPRPRAFAHRGWHTGDLAGLENTAAAFSRAVREGYRYLETDVHATSDGVLVAFHDSALDRVTDRSGTVGQLPWSDVRKARIGGREPIPLLEDLLGDLPDALVNIDAKADPAVLPLLDVLRRTRAFDRVCIASFSSPRLRKLRSLLPPGVATSLGRRGVERLVARAHRVPVPPLPCGAVAAQVPRRSGRIEVVTPRFVEVAHRVDVEVHVWTVDEPGEMRRLLDMGVDGLITDRPDLLREVLRERAQWA